ncbi:MAG: urease accessory protein UreE [Pseudomonadota bacterium]
MEMLTTIVGTSDDPELAAPLHRLEHADAVDVLRLPRADLARRRLRATTSKGVEIAIALPRETPLHDGAVLRLDDHGALVVRVEAEHWLRVRPAGPDGALRLGYHAGNLHWRVRFDGSDLLIALEGPEERYRDRLAEQIKDGFCRIIAQEPV